MFSSEIFLRPRSTLETYVRSNPASFAKASCEMPRSSRNLRTHFPKMTLMSGTQEDVGVC